MTRTEKHSPDRPCSLPGLYFCGEVHRREKRFPLKQQIPPAQMHRGDFKYQKLLNVFDRVLEAVLFLQLLHLGLAVLDEGGGVDRSAIVGLFVVLNDLLQLCPASLALFWSMLSGKLMMNSRCLGIRAFMVGSPYNSLDFDC